jgi:hypothetical protein
LGQKGQFVVGEGVVPVETLADLGVHGAGFIGQEAVVEGLDTPEGVGLVLGGAVGSGAAAEGAVAITIGAVPKAGQEEDAGAFVEGVAALRVEFDDGESLEGSVVVSGGLDRQVKQSDEEGGVEPVGDGGGPEGVAEVGRKAFEGEFQDDPLAFGVVLSGLELGQEAGQAVGRVKAAHCSW